ncbi:SusC/RagA family TonB-linked outer membrane protein [Chryseolinea soli]|uniref:TonB-dependent receptor n=1 Tax=Chryseolinea soli TaxID=2321403 RepID=A0A385SXS7_9BACT|nr:TonB-dependent receptor [Chryseolinea soli]AYB34855.1 TonB-dependent receptor [Chryseolinea soli]
MFKLYPKCILVVILLCLFASSMNAQGQTITGIVTEADASPLPGVNVLIKGTTNGTSTDAEGKFSLSVNDANATLVFSFIGYLTQEVALQARTSLTVELQPDVRTLNEIVVVGYGTQRRADVTGAIASVGSERIASRPSANPLDAIVGQVPGLSIASNGGRPGGDLRINIRGFNSINASNAPLFVIDGIVGADINFINPADIESMDVLKDASATAIYGARGANGVVIVNTKKAKSGDLVTTYSGTVGVDVLARKVDVLNSDQYMANLRAGYAFVPGRPVPDFAALYPDLFNADGSPKYNTDWQDEATRAAFTQRHNLTISGGTEKSRTGLSLGYQNLDGILLNTFYKKYNVGFNNEVQLKPWLKLSTNVMYSYTKTNRIDDYGVGANNATRVMTEFLPMLPVKYADGHYSRLTDFLNMFPVENPVRLLNELQKISTDNQLLGNLAVQIKLTPSLSFKSTVGVESKNFNVDFYAGRDLLDISASQKGSATRSSQRILFWQNENFMNYNKTFGQHHIDAILGASWSQSVDQSFTTTVTGFSDDAYQFNNLGAGTVFNAGSGYTAWKLNSYYARANYNYADKYLFTATGRYDGSSKFGKDNRYAFFPSAAVGWRISNEGFLNTSNVISDLKLRFSSGVTGNSEIGPYAAQGSTGNYTVILNEARTPGIAMGGIPNPSLKWEKTIQQDLGLDLGVLHDRIRLTADLYLKRTKDLLLAKPIPFVSGYGTVTDNIGELENKGIELSLQTHNIRSSNFQWNSIINYSANRNKIIALGANNEDIFPGPGFLAQTNILRVGESVGSFWGYRRLGTYSTDEVDEAARYGKKPGDLKRLDKDNNGTFNDKDREVIGHAYPKFELMVGNTFTYKNFDLSIDIRGVYGNQVLNLTHHSMEDRIWYANSYTSTLDAWTPEHQNTQVGKLRLAPFDGTDTTIDSRFVEDGSFIRGQNLTLGYRFSPGLLDKLGLKAARLSFNVQNFFLISNYKGFDPEVSTYTQSFAQGIEFHGYPKSRSFNLGVNVQF